MRLHRDTSRHGTPNSLRCGRASPDWPGLIPSYPRVQADELISHTYHNIYGMSLTGLRFFTVYGPWGRPDMAAFKFAKNIMMGVNITVFQVLHQTLFV